MILQLGLFWVKKQFSKDFTLRATKFRFDDNYQTS